MGPYIDHSPRIEGAENIGKAQSGLASLGFDLGKSGVDGDWGLRSEEAARQWQTVNGYEETGIITTRQLTVLEHQAKNPEIFNQLKLKDFSGAFNTENLSHLDPARRAIVTQALSHVGAKEDGNNRGAAFDQYAEATGINAGDAWCATFDHWNRQQLEKAASLEPSLHANPSVTKTFEEIVEKAPGAIKSLSEYVPQAGDRIFVLNDRGTGHLAIALSSEHEGDYHGINTIGGNQNDGVNGGAIITHTDPATGRSFLVDKEGTVHYDSEVVIVDTSALPGYDRLNSAFNTVNGYTPTPSSDPNFKLDTEQLRVINDLMAGEHQKALANQQAPMLPPLNFGHAAQMGISQPG